MVSTDRSPLTPLEKPHHQPRWWLLGLGLIVVMLLGLSLLVIRRTPANSSVGVRDRSAVDLHGLDQSTAVRGQCIDQFLVEAAGREGGQQRYLLTMSLTGNPGNPTELASFLEQEACQAESAPIADRVTKELGIQGTPGVLLTSYRTKAGTRLILP